MDKEINSYESIKPMIDAIRANFSAISEIKKNIDSADLSEAAQMYLMDALGYTQAQAQEVVDDLRKGLDSYATQRNAMEECPDALETGIKDSIDKYSEEERKDILVNVLTALQLEQASNADIETLRSANAALSEDELIKAVAGSLDGLPFANVADIAGSQIGNDTLTMLEALRDMSSYEYKLAAAILLYIIQQQGKLPLGNDGSPLPPEIIGAMTGASVDVINAAQDLRAGRIDLKKWQRILKWILGAIFIVAFCSISAVAILSVSLGLMHIINAILGIGLLSSTLALIAVFAFCVKACEWQDSGLDYAMEKMSAVYDKAITKLTEWANALREKIAVYAGKAKAEPQANAQAENKENTGAQGHNADANDCPAAPALA